MVNITGFADSTVSVTTKQHCHGPKAAVDKKQAWVCANTALWMLKSESGVIFHMSKSAILLLTFFF